MPNYTISKCFIRFEPNINNGTMFLFNKETGVMLEGNYFSYIVSKDLLDGKNLAEIVNRIATETNQCEDIVKQNVDTVVDFLANEGFLKYDRI